MYKDSPFLDDRYDAVTIENRGKKFWEEKKVYQYDATRSR